MEAHTRAYILLHVAVILFGFTAILGDLISISALEIVWWRVLLTSLSLIFFINVIRLFKTMHWRRVLVFLFIGMIVGLHWLCFYGAIKYAGASIALICMATTSFFTALLEPLIMRLKRKKSQIITGVVIIPAMALIAFDVEPVKVIGIWIGLISAALAALFASLNKKYIHSANPYAITFLEMVGALVLTSLALIFFYTGLPASFPSQRDLILLIILVLFCTTLAYVLSLKALKYLTAFESNLVINLEPVYGIIMAALILKEFEELTMGFYVGSTLILLTVIGYPIYMRRN